MEVVYDVGEEGADLGAGCKGCFLQAQHIQIQ